MSSYITELQINSETAQPVGSSLYGICSTAASTAAKTVTLAAFDTLIDGVTVHVKFANGNTAALNSSLTLAVGSTTAYPIANPGGSVSWAENSVISFTYDDTAHLWRVNDGNVSTITILNTYDSSSTSGISGQGVAAALATLGAAASKGVDTTIPSSSPSDDNVPTSAAVASYVSSAFGAADALIFKGTLGSNSGDTISAIPTGGYSVGWTYRVTTAGTYGTHICEVGDLLIAITDASSGQSTANDAHWTVAQTNIDSGLYKGTNSFTDTHVLIADGTGGKVKDSGFTIGKSVPSDAVFTDTTYTATASTTINYLSDANYVKSASVTQGVLHLATVTTAPTITPVTAITAST